MEVVADLCKAIRFYSIEATKLEDIKTTMPHIIQQHVSSNDIRRALAKCAVERTPLKDVTFPLPVEVTDGLHLLCQPIGSLTFVKVFFAKKMINNEMDTRKLLSVFSDFHTALCLFGQ